MHDPKIESVIVCCGCGVALERRHWPQHRSNCFALGKQLALSEELADSAAASDFADDLRSRRATTAKPNTSTCPFCHARTGELCVNKQGKAMTVSHLQRQERAALAAQRPHHHH